MEREFFKRKVQELSDDKLFDLLKLGRDANQEVIELATEEAKKRGLEVPDVSIPADNDVPAENGDRKKLGKWNWGAFLLAPIWTLANKLEKWTILTFIPGINVITVFYLGFRGNRMAYEKSNLDDVDDFMALQHQWNIWGIRIFWISLAGLIVGFVGGL